MIGLGDLSDPVLESVAFTVSADGSVVAGAGAPSSSEQEATVWTAAGGWVPVGLGDIDCCDRSRHSRVTQMSADGSILAGLAIGSSGNEAAIRWTQATGMVELWPGRAFAVSSDGTTFVGSGLPNDTPVRWTEAGGLVRLTHNNGGGANAVSADGSVVVGGADLSTTTGANHRAFRWDIENGLRDLEYILFPEPTAWTLTEAAGVSADGQIIVGGGTDSAGNAIAWVGEGQVPEPQVGAFLAAGTAWLAGCNAMRRRGRRESIRGVRRSMRTSREDRLVAVRGLEPRTYGL